MKIELFWALKVLLLVICALLMVTADPLAFYGTYDRNHFQLYFRTTLPDPTTQNGFQSLDSIDFQPYVLTSRAFDFTMLQAFIIDEHGITSRLSNFDPDDSSLNWKVSHTFASPVSEVMILLDCYGAPRSTSQDVARPGPTQYEVTITLSLTIQDIPKGDAESTTTPFSHKIKDSFGFFAIDSGDRILSTAPHPTIPEALTFDAILSNSAYNTTIATIPSQLSLRLLSGFQFSPESGDCLVNGMGVDVTLSKDNMTILLTPPVDEVFFSHPFTPAISISCNAHPFIPYFPTTDITMNMEFMMRHMMQIDFYNQNGDIYDSRVVSPRFGHSPGNETSIAPFPLAVVSRGFIDSNILWTRTTFEWDLPTFKTIIPLLYPFDNTTAPINNSISIAYSLIKNPDYGPEMPKYQLHSVPYFTNDFDDDDDDEETMDSEKHVPKTRSNYTTITSNFTSPFVFTTYFYNSEFNKTDPKSENIIAYRYYGQHLTLQDIFNSYTLNITSDTLKNDTIIRYSVENYSYSDNTTSLTEVLGGFDQQYSGIVKYTFDNQTHYTVPYMESINTNPLTNNIVQTNLLKYTKASGFLLEIADIANTINFLRITLPQHNYYFSGQIDTEECTFKEKLQNGKYSVIGHIFAEFEKDHSAIPKTQHDSVIFDLSTLTPKLRFNLTQGASYQIECYRLRISPRFYDNLPFNLMTLQGKFIPEDNEIDDKIVIYQTTLTFKPLPKINNKFVYYLAIGGLCLIPVLFLIVYSASGRITSSKEKNEIKHSEQTSINDTTQNLPELDTHTLNEHQSINSGPGEYHSIE